ncbi:hypothetical protein [Microbacterium sp. YJN-G]|uniref:hypothetical protein n=1 Tax=Microbacterium sp. YJN-G TaxID=2763257 RepID=UPI001878E40C|nr:hypothetical protein [Microbacterium sp. YJN-G]
MHYATCPDYGMQEAYERARALGLPGVAYTPRCTGCAEKPARDHALICDGCFYRLRTLVRDADDLMGRLQSLADPMKATPTDKAPGGRSQQVEPPAPVDADLLDALNDVYHTLHDWDRMVDPQSLEHALPDLVNDVEHVRVLGIGFLDRNPLVDGVRGFWSVQDAVDKWGVERRTKGEKPWEPEDDRELATFPVQEWGEGSWITKLQAEKIAGSARTLRRWVARDLLSHEGTVVIAGVVTRMFRRSDVVRVRDQMQAKVGRPSAARDEGSER